MNYLNAERARPDLTAGLSAKTEQADSGEIHVIGPARDFPECYPRLVETEIAGARWVALGDGMGVLDRLSEIRDHVAMIVVGENAGTKLDQIVALAGAAPVAPPVVLAYRHPMRVAAAFETFGLAQSGVSFLPMRSDVETWIGIVRLVMSGGQYLPPELIQERLGAARQAAVERGAKGDGHLTKREATVLELVSEGRQNKQIAAMLNLSEHTVKMHVHRACRKLGARNRTEAARLFRERQP